MAWPSLHRIIDCVSKHVLTAKTVAINHFPTTEAHDIDLKVADTSFPAGGSAVRTYKTAQGLIDPMRQYACFLYPGFVVCADWGRFLQDALVGNNGTLMTQNSPSDMVHRRVFPRRVCTYIVVCVVRILKSHKPAHQRSSRTNGYAPSQLCSAGIGPRD